MDGAFSADSYYCTTMRPGIRIMLQDDSIIVAEKPPGILVHPNAKDSISPNCVSVLGRILRRKIYTIHRIDRATSGIVVFALYPEAADGIAAQFRDRSVLKRYIAVVRGHIDEVTEVDRPVRRGSDGEWTDASSIIRPLSRTVVHEPVGPYGEAWYSLVEVDLLTGRTNQARKHLKHLSRPIIGDRKDGDRAHNDYIAGRFGVPHMFLRSYRLDFTHPATGQPVSSSAGFPDWWLAVSEGIGLEIPPDLPPEARLTIDGEDRLGGRIV